MNVQKPQLETVNVCPINKCLLPVAAYMNAGWSREYMRGSTIYNMVCVCFDLGSFIHIRIRTVYIYIYIFSFRFISNTVDCGYWRHGHRLDCNLDMMTWHQIQHIASLELHRGI
eukprot:705643_1